MLDSAVKTLNLDITRCYFILATQERSPLYLTTHEISTFPFSQSTSIVLAKQHITLPDATFFSAEEQARRAKYLLAEDSQRFAVSHFLKRHVCAAYKKTSPHLLRFATQEQGKPYILAPHADVHFSISHSDAWCAVAVNTGHSIGFDIQNVFVAGDAPLESFWHPHDAIKPNNAQDMAVLWSMKEAVLKAHGCGLFFPLQELCIKATSHAQLFKATLHGKDYTIRVWLWAEGYAMALASESLQDVEIYQIL